MFRSRTGLVTFVLDNGDQIFVVIPQITYFTRRNGAIRIGLLDGTTLSSTGKAEESFDLLRKAISAYYS